MEEQSTIDYPTKFCKDCGEKINVKAEICPKCGVRQEGVVKAGGRSKIAAGLFGIFLGGFGIHKFYLGQVGWGIIYLIFCWSFIPEIAGFIEGIIYLTMSDEAFAAKYGR
ncbi:MAG: TM2 domain-containing protein [bacterium]